MPKSKETYLKVAETYDKMGKKKWAEAKNNPDEGYKYQQARANLIQLKEREKLQKKQNKRKCVRRKYENKVHLPLSLIKSDLLNLRGVTVDVSPTIMANFAI